MKRTRIILKPDLELELVWVSSDEIPAGTVEAQSFRVCVDSPNSRMPPLMAEASDS